MCNYDLIYRYGLSISIGDLTCTY